VIVNKRKLLCSSICLCLANFAFVEAALAKNSGRNPCKALRNDPNVVVVTGGIYNGSAETEGKIIIGSNRADDITGTPYDDVICGNNGNDTVRGGAGADTIYGGNGNDSLYGEGFAAPATCAPTGAYTGQCDDTIRGNNGKDKIYGENGHDDLAGGTGKDRLYGDFTDNVTCPESSTVDIGGVLTNVPNCDDTLTGGNGKDSLNGGPRDDSLDGRRGNDQCTGTADDTPGNIASCETILP
jgi:Ca2+-binding RTX toxin-like protein